MALDDFLQGFLEFVRSLRGSDQHQWRAWVANTQASTQQGSHWFTVVAGVRQSIAQELDAGAATEHIVEQASAASAVATRLAESSQQGRTHATEPSCPDKIVFDRLSENPSATTLQLLRWASSNKEKIPVVADTLRKLGEWNAVTKKLGTHKRLRALAKSHGTSIPRHVFHAQAAEAYPT